MDSTFRGPDPLGGSGPVDLRFSYFLMIHADADLRVLALACRSTAEDPLGVCQTLAPMMTLPSILPPSL